MTWRTRFKLLTGLIVIGALGVMATAYVDRNLSQVTTNKAQIDAHTYSVGVSSSSQVTQQYVEVGDTVKTGQTLFTVASRELREEMETSENKTQDPVYELLENGDIAIKASKPGLVQKIKYPQGSFVPDNAEIATITDGTSMFITATYEMNRPSYEKLHTNSAMKVKLPDGSTVDAKVRQITILSNDPVIKARVEAVVQNASAASVKNAPGTPVVATIDMGGAHFYNAVIGVLRQVRP